VTTGVTATFSVYRATGMPQRHYPDLVTGVSRDDAEKSAITRSAADPGGIYVIERDDTWKIAAEYRGGQLRRSRPHDARALRKHREGETHSESTGGDNTR
jgi:hypothetical protein